MSTYARRGPAGVMLARRERGRTALQAAERLAKRTKEEKVLRDEEARLVLIEAQKVEPSLLLSLVYVSVGVVLVLLLAWMCGNGCDVMRCAMACSGQLT